jgi:hypothetical protein
LGDQDPIEPQGLRDGGHPAKECEQLTQCGPRSYGQGSSGAARIRSAHKMHGTGARVMLAAGQRGMRRLCGANTRHAATNQTRRLGPIVFEEPAAMGIVEKIAEIEAEVRRAYTPGRTMHTLTHTHWRRGRVDGAHAEEQGHQPPHWHAQGQAGQAAPGAHHPLRRRWRQGGRSACMHSCFSAHSSVTVSSRAGFDVAKTGDARVGFVGMCMHAIECGIEYACR